MAVTLCGQIQKIQRAKTPKPKTAKAKKPKSQI